MEQGVVLCLTVHEPDLRLAALTEALLPPLVKRYAAVVAVCSRTSHPAMLELLHSHGVLLELDVDEPSGIDRIGEVRRKTIRAGLRAGTAHLQMCDFDRALHWVARYPAEMEAVIAEIPETDLLVLGRTERAWATNPPYQAETEPLFNHVISLATGLAWDIGAGSRGLSHRAASALLECSKEKTVGVDAEWPLLLLRREGFRLRHRLCEGLEFETADRFAPEIQSAGSYQAWEAQMNADPKRCAFRLRVAYLIAEAVVRYADL
jgi:hypothetical protein